MSSNTTAIVGVGHSPVFRHDEVRLGTLTIDAATKAIEDAGLTPADIDGVIADPMQPFDGAGAVDGIHFVSPEYVINAMKLDVGWYESTPIVGLARTIIEGSNAVASGNCKAVLVFRSLHNPGGRYGVTAPTTADGMYQFLSPYGLFPPGFFAHLWHRYMSKYGTSREQMAPFIVNNRKNGLLWDHSYWRQHRPEELTVEDYLEARMISTPFGLYDCDLPVQGSGAFVITSGERAKDLPHLPAYIRGWAVPGPIGGWHIWSPLETLQKRATTFATRLLSNADITVDDIDVTNVYDGFSIFVPLWLEAFGFCGEGEAFDFMEPANIAIEGGKFPLNTSGGNLGAGRMHGVPQVMESVLQIMGRSGARQVQRAEVALATAGGQPGSAGGIVFSSTPR